MKKSERVKMKTVKIAEPVHSRLITVANATGETISQVIDDLLNVAYPEARDVNAKIKADIETLGDIIRRKRSQRKQ